MKRGLMAGVTCAVALLPLLWIGALWHFKATHAPGFEAVRVGDPDTRVFALMGEPTHVEARGEGFPRFADRACQPPCARRLWYATRLNLDIEAWSVELDATDRVIATAHWVSP
jgi:hypothetical protein